MRKKLQLQLFQRPHRKKTIGDEGKVMALLAAKENGEVPNKARSFVNCMVGKNMKKENTGHCQTQKNFPPYFINEGNAQMKTGYQQQIQFDDEGDQWIDSDEEDSSNKVKKRAPDYLGTLDWESLQNHIIYFPRKRSDAEIRLIYEKWAAHYDRKYPSAELKETRFATFKKRLAIIDKGNLKGEFTSVLKAVSDI